MVKLDSEQMRWLEEKRLEEENRIDSELVQQAKAYLGPSIAAPHSWPNPTLMVIWFLMFMVLLSDFEVFFSLALYVSLGYAVIKDPLLEVLKSMRAIPSEVWSNLVFRCVISRFGHQYLMVDLLLDHQASLSFGIRLLVFGWMMIWRFHLKQDLEKRTASKPEL
ncbi:MAG: hypothetical protein KDC71_15620 [Acidobacteria bacterium]|nr:hypothetical protein [Acidobacteriota bacterium]